MPPLTEGKTPGDFLLFEEHDHYCRAEVTIAAGANLEPGTVLGKITASGKFTTHETGVSDGSQTAVAVLVTAAAAESADAVAVALVRGPCRVRRGGLMFGASLDTVGERNAAVAALETVGIVAT